MFTNFDRQQIPASATKLRHWLPTYLEPSLALPDRQLLEKRVLCHPPQKREEVEFLEKVASAYPNANNRAAFLTRWHNILVRVGVNLDELEIYPPTFGVRDDGVPYVVQPRLSHAKMDERRVARSSPSFDRPLYMNHEAIHQGDCGLCLETAGELEAVKSKTTNERIFLFRPNFIVIPDPFPNFVGDCVVARPGHDPSFWQPEVRPSPSIHTLKAWLNLASELDGSLVRGHSRVRMSIPGHAHSHFVPIEFVRFPALDAATTEGRFRSKIGTPFFLQSLPYEAVAIVGDSVTKHAEVLFGTLDQLDKENVPYILAHAQGTTLIIPCEADGLQSVQGTLLNFKSVEAAQQFDWSGLLRIGELKLVLVER